MAADIHKGMTATYKWMRSRMEPRLHDALRDVELNYYNMHADAQSPGAAKHLTPTHMRHVADEAIKRSTAGLGDKGWKAT